MKFKSTIITKLLLFVSAMAFSQTVNVDLSKQRFLGNTSDLDRSKFFNIHDKNFDSFTSPFLQANNVGFGRRFFGPFEAKGRGNFPQTPGATLNGVVRPVSRFIATGRPTSIWRPGFDTTLAGNTAVRYWIDEVATNDRPEYWEPFNEPFVKAENPNNVDLRTDPVTMQTFNTRETITQMSEWFRDIAQKVHTTTELGNMKVIGFSDAFPSFERSGFSNWRDRSKKFIDIAGADMDALSVHPYDGVNITGQDNRRAGSNSEAILDLLNTYTAQQFGGTPKKLAITEFGIIEKGFPAGPAPDFYNEPENAITLRAINALMFNFFEREDNIEICIPFITGRSDFWYNQETQDGMGNTIWRNNRPYVPALTIPTEVFPNTVRPKPYRNNTFQLTFKQNFYKFWKDVKGKRVQISTDDIDIQVQAFLDGSTLYVALNNLDDANKTVNLNFSNNGSVNSVSTSSLIIQGQNTPIYNTGSNSPTIPASVPLNIGETKLLAITYDSSLSFTSSIIREKYYGTAANSSDIALNRAPIIKAQAGTSHQFNFTGINKGTLGNGKATLRLTVGVPLEQPFGANKGQSEGLNILPDEVKINNTILTSIPTNWKGYDQSGRIEFFGTIEINVPYNLLNTGNNTVEVKYNTTQGVTIYNIRDLNGNDAFERANVFIASTILSVERNEATCTTTTIYADEDNDGLGDPANSIQNCGPLQGFVDNMNDLCPNDTENACAGIPIPGVINAEKFIASRPGGQVQSEAGAGNSSGQVIGFIKNPDYTDYRINAVSAGIYEFTISAAAGAAFGGDVEILIDGISVGSVTIPATNTAANFPFNIYQNFIISNVTIAAGIHDLRLMFTDNDTTDDFLFNIDTITVDLDPTLSVDVFEKSTGFKLTSNPVDSELKFTTDKAEGEAYSIYSISGKLVSKGIFNNSVSVDSFEKGIYFIEIKGAATKFVKQ